RKCPTSLFALSMLKSTSGSSEPPRENASRFRKPHGKLYPKNANRQKRKSGQRSIDFVKAPVLFQAIQRQISANGTTMTSLIVDASIAVKWFFGEPDSQRANNLRDGEFDFIAPEFIAEIGNGAWKKRSRNEIDVAGAIFVVR